MRYSTIQAIRTGFGMVFMVGFIAVTLTLPLTITLLFGRSDLVGVPMPIYATSWGFMCIVAGLGGLYLWGVPRP